MGSDIDKDKLANFYKDIRAEAFRSGGAPMTARHIESIIRLSEASARIELRQHVNSKDLDFARSIRLPRSSERNSGVTLLRQRHFLTNLCAYSRSFSETKLKIFVCKEWMLMPQTFQCS